MKELSLHIMDIIENGLGAGATLIYLTIWEDRQKKRLKISIRDNGRGMSEEVLRKALDPFFTTRTTRRVGLGLSLFREASRRCDGEFNIKSVEGEGTETSATFRLDHIDLAPLGDMAGTMAALIMGNPEVDFVYRHEVDGEVFELDTRQIRKELDGAPINTPGIVKYIRDMIRDSLADLGPGRSSPGISTY